MGIKDMLKREDFYKLLADTVMNYAHLVLGKEAEVTYDKGGSDQDEWAVNSLLGFVSRTPSPAGLKSLLKSEYNVRGSFLKNLLGKVAVEVVCAFPCVGRCRKMYVTKGVFPKEVFISPQNRSIRFYDYSRKIVDCMVKTGFTHKYFDAQASFRKQHNYLFMNPMLDSGEGWFREPILSGHPLARTTDQNAYEKGLKDAVAYICELAQDTLEMAKANEYVSELKDRLEQKLAKAVTVKKITSSDKAKIIIEKTSDHLLQLEGEIPTCLSHGDFQSGNIWVGKDGKTLIYDWETVGRRSIWYDSATIYYSLRRAYGWRSFWEDNLITSLSDIYLIPEGMTAKMIKCLIMLEDFEFYLDDMLELPSVWGREECDEFIDRELPNIERFV